MSRTVSATEVRAHFGEMMRHAVERNEPIIVERAGKPHVVILSIAEYERLRGEESHEPPVEQDWWEMARQSRERVRRSLNGRPMPDVSEVIREMREERDAQLLDGLLPTV